MSEAHLALMTKLEELDAYTHTVLHQFPKLERHLLCAEMRAVFSLCFDAQGANLALGLTDCCACTTRGFRPAA